VRGAPALRHAFTAQAAAFDMAAFQAEWQRFVLQLRYP
jgi:hypothetical protein